jgi:hypothetical protein
MEASLVSAVANANLQTVNGAASVSALKKALDTQQQTALSLLESIPAPQYNNPANLGASVDVKV